MTPRAAPLAAALASAALVACSAAPPGDPPAPVERTSSTAAALSGPVTRAQVIANAEQWVDAKLLYCQSANGARDYDTSCSSVCMRESNPAWDPYRSDCSGFVSWAWELPAPGLVTSDFAPIGQDDSTVIDCADMLPGDAANRYPDDGHIVLFEKWITPGQEALFFEEPGCSSSTPYAHEFQSAVTCTGSTVDIAYEGDTFTAIRYVNILDDADAGAPADAGSAHDASPPPRADAGGVANHDAGAIVDPSADASSGQGDNGGGFDTSTPASSGGCGVAPATAGNAWGLAALVLGLVAARRRRAR